MIGEDQKPCVIHLLLLVDAEGVVTTSELTIRQLREFPGGEGVSVHFRPVRNDLLSSRPKSRPAWHIGSWRAKA